MQLKSVSTNNKTTIPFSIYILAFGIFAIVTSEFQVAGMLPVMAQDLSVSIAQIGYLVSIYALGMAVGGPLLAIFLLHKPPKTALLILFAIFIVGEALGALAPQYLTLIIARLITGAASGAFFGIALAICIELVTEIHRGWAIAIVLSGIMLGTIIGLPMANLIGTHLGWRESFWAVCVLSLFASGLCSWFIPNIEKQAVLSLSAELTSLRQSRIWWVFATSLLIIGATFSAFTYFTPILKQLAGFSDNAVTLLLIMYGIATLIGNTVVGKFAERYTIKIIFIGLFSLSCFLLLFALFPSSKLITLLAVFGIGLVGVTMNPAMVTRVIRTANGRPVINTLHSSVITLGVVTGSFFGGLGISYDFGLTAPLWVGLIMAILGLTTLLIEYPQPKTKLASLKN